jgi:hypothetical protein
MAREWRIPRAEQDRLAAESHHKAALAYDEGFFDELVIPWNGAARDNNLRADTTLEKLASLRTAFSTSDDATLTAGNSTPLTDGAAAVLLASEEWARQHDLPVQAYLTAGRASAVDFVHDEGLLMAPTVAVAELLQRTGLRLQDFDFYEIHEAFAAQVLCTLAAWESETYCRNRLGLDHALGSIDRERLNVKGSSLAVGHPLRQRGTHRGHPGPIARTAGIGPRPEFDLYRRRHGRRGHNGTAMNGPNAGQATQWCAGTVAAGYRWWLRRVISGPASAVFNISMPAWVPPPGAGLIRMPGWKRFQIQYRQ